MTYLTKPVRRATRARVPYGVNEIVIVTLYPGGVIGFREKKRRKEYQLDIGTLYVRAVVAEINAQRKERRKRR